VALLTMFANQGIVKMEDLLKSLYDENRPFRKFYKHWLLSLKPAMVEDIISKLIKSQTVTYPKGEVREAI
jgi:hypothetical protein